MHNTHLGHFQISQVGLQEILIGWIGFQGSMYFISTLPPALSSDFAAGVSQTETPTGSCPFSLGSRCCLGLLEEAKLEG